MTLSQVRILVDDVPASFRSYIASPWGIRVVYLRGPSGKLVELHEDIPLEEE